MSEHSQFALLRERRFLPFFLTQSLGAFNDNVFKNGMIVLFTLSTWQLAEAQKSLFSNAAAGLFILPFFLFSATSGQISERYDKARLAVLVKILEIAIMAVGAYGFLRHDVYVLLAMLFMMGFHSTVFGPLKYGLLPQVLTERELVGGNGLVEMGTFIAILAGSILGTQLIGVGAGGTEWIAVATIVAAVLGLVTALAMPKLPPVAPELAINWNVFTETARSLSYLKGNRTVFLSCLGISWFWFYGSIYFTQLSVYTSSILGGNTGVYTLLLAIFTIGIAVGSMLCEKLSGHRVEIGLVPFGSIGMTLFGADLYFAHPDAATATEQSWQLLIHQPGIVRVLIDLAMMALFSGFYIVPLFALIQSRTEASHRSRVIAANNILNAAFMVVASVMAVVLLKFAHVSIPMLLLITAVLNAFVAIYIYTLVPEFLMRFLAWILVNTLYRIEVKGLENVPEDGPVVVVANHVSFLDALIIGGTIRRPIRFVMYYKIFQMPLLSFMFRTARAIPIAGKKEDPAMMDRAFAEVDRELAAGEVVGIFPEGGLTRTGEIDRFRPGVERIIAARPVPVLPVALRGMWGSLFSRKDSALGRARLPRKFLSRIAVVVGEPVPAEQATAELLEAKVRELRGDWA